MQEKNKPTPTTYCIYDNTKKKNSYWIPFIVNVINDYHNNSRVVKGMWKEGSKKKKIIMKLLVAIGLWKEGNKGKKNYCEGACDHVAL
jgi:hypothetical protein